MPLTALGISAGSSLLGGLLGSSASKSAAGKLGTAGTAASNSLAQATSNAQNAVNTQVPLSLASVNSATGNANSLLGNTLGAQQNALAPYTQAGAQGVNGLASALAPGGQLATSFSFNPASITSNPNYQFQLQQGLQAVNQQAAAQGGALGGGNEKALTQYSQGLASSAINDAYSQALNTYQTNYGNTFQGLSALSNIGQSSTNSLLGALQNSGNQQASNTLQGGYYNANTPLQSQQYSGQTGISGTQASVNALLQGLGAQSGYNVQGTNALASGLTGVGNAFQNYNQSNLLQSLLSNSGNYASSPSGGLQNNNLGYI